MRECSFCGGKMSHNPHPDAGIPAFLLEVGAAYECIPCSRKNVHNWSERALKAENKLALFQEEIKKASDEALLTEEVIINMVTDYHFSGETNRHTLVRRAAKAQLDKYRQTILKRLDNK